MLNAALLLCAFACAGIAALLGFDVFDGEHVLGWLSLAVTFLVAASLVGYVPWKRGE